MTRLVLLIILGIVAAFYFPDSRALIMEKAQPALTPFYKWQTKKEMNEIARSLQDYERENFGSLPDRRSFPRWLEQNFHGETAKDTWGGLYALQARSDSFFVISKGPDLVYRTDDDIRVAWRRARAGRR